MSTVNLERARANFADDIRRRGGIKSAALIEGLATILLKVIFNPSGGCGVTGTNRVGTAGYMGTVCVWRPTRPCGIPPESQW